MASLILLSHGSRRPSSNEEMIALAESVAGLEGNAFDQVRCAFQQFAEPTFEKVVSELVKENVNRIIVFPLFLSSGSHVLEDVPELVESTRALYPHLEVTVTAHLGGTNDFADFLLKSVSELP